jgi:glycerol-3-phosphate dehydrogenase
LDSRLHLTYDEKKGEEEMGRLIETQVLIIGAGTTGTAIARELSKYNVDTILIEKREDVGMGETRASHGFIHSRGLAAAGSLVMKSVMLPNGQTAYNPRSRKTQMEHESVKEFPSLAKELEVDLAHYRWLVVAKDEDDLKMLKVAERICEAMGTEVTWLDREGILEREPYVTKNVIAGIADEGYQLSVYPWDWAIALAENAKQNGVRLMLLTEVIAIKPLDGGFLVYTNRGPIRTEFMINAAGPYADQLAKMAGVCDFGLTYTRSQMLILDKSVSLVNQSVSLAPKPGKVGTLRKTFSGNIQTICSEYYPVNDPEDTATLMKWTNESIAGAQEMIPSISKRDIITSYVGVRVFNTRDPEEDILEASEGNPRFLNAAIRLPGVTVTPAAARHIVDLLGNQGLELTTKTDFNPHRKRIPKIIELPDEERKKLIAQDSRYGHIVCRCEEVSEGEIVEAIKRGARTVTGVKYRTRAGMGRCQRGFCGPRVLEILARELDIPMREVTQMGGLSRLLLHRSKELLRSGD